MKVNLHNENKGLTLIELIISMAILSIVLLIVISFLVTGSRSFTYASNEVNVQTEIQTVMNQLEDIIIESNWVDIVDISAGDKALIIYSQSEVNVVVFNSTSKKLYLIDGATVDLNHLSTITYTENDNLMADQILDINLLNYDPFNPGEIIKGKKIQLELRFEKDASHSSSVVKTMYFRNQPVIPAPTATPTTTPTATPTTTPTTIPTTTP